MRNRYPALLLTFSAFLLGFIALFLARSVDDNSLFSWSWVFEGVNGSRVYLALLAGLVVSLLFSTTAVPARYQIPVLAALSFTAIVPLWQESELIIDASRYFTQAKNLELYGITYFFREWGREITAWTDMPLVPFLYGLLFRICGEHRTAIQVFTTVLFSLTTVLTCLIGQKLWDRETGFSAGLMLLGIPYLLLQVPLMLVDVPSMFFLALSVFAFLSALTGNGAVKAGGAVVAIVCTVLAKYSAWFTLSVLPVILLVYAVQSAGVQRRSVIKRGIAILLVSAAVVSLALLLKREVVSQQIALLLHYQKPGLARWGETLYSTFLFQVHPFITFLAVASFAVAYRNRDPKQGIVTWLVLLVIVCGIRRIRYTLPIFPMLTLMAGYGLKSIQREDVRRFILYGVVSSSLVIAFLGYLPFALTMSSNNLKLAGEYLNRLKTDTVQVFVIGPQQPSANLATAVPLLDLFTTKQIQYSYGADDVSLLADVRTSSLRFTWEYRNPKYYTAETDAKCNNTIVVISGVPPEPISESLKKELNYRQPSKIFAANHDIFQLSFSVSIYKK